MSGPTRERERELLDLIDSLNAELTRARELAAWFQAEYTRTLPVVASFRHWRTGGDTKTFHAQLVGDTCGKAISLGTVAPMQAMTELNDWLAREEISSGGVRGDA